MKLIIDIPDEVKQKIDENLNACDLDIYDCVMLATKNGIPLPKGHGAIIDVKDIEKIHIVDNNKVTLYKLGTDVEAYIYATPLVKADEEINNETYN